MLEKPNIPDERICSCLSSAYGLRVNALTFLPLGADINTAVYRAEESGGGAYFVKLRRGGFRPVTVMVPAFLQDQDVPALIPPLKTLTSRLWAVMDGYKMILYPFVEGLNGYETALSDQHWLEFGVAMRAIHTTNLPAPLARLAPREKYSPVYRRQVSAFQRQARQADFSDPAAARLAALMCVHEETIRELVRQAAALARVLRAGSLPFTLCHADLHAGNLHIGADGRLYIIDWDTLMLAPREHDLTLIGGCHLWNDPKQIALFYQGYASNELDKSALAYYRSERVIMDIAAFCSQLFLSDEGGPDREQALAYFASNFLPGAEIDLANQTL